MTRRTQQILSFALASVFSAPFVLVLALFGLLASFPSLRAPSPSIGDVVFLAFFLIPGPIGFVGIALAGACVWMAFRNRTGSSAQLYALVFYAAVLLCYVVYLGWWYGTGQKLDAP
jgi:hypothetical protein